METNSTPIITIPKHTDKHLGFLNSSYISPFEINGQKWQSVERYVFAKQFEGTVLEEKIKTAKNMFLAKLLAKKKKILIEDSDGRLVRLTVYGNENCQISNGYNYETKRKHLKKATKAKFKQNKKLMAMLLKTKGIKIKSSCEILGEILEEIRLDSGKPKKVNKRTISNPKKDIKSGILNEDIESSIFGIKNGIKWIKEVENIKDKGNCETEILEDVFYNFFDEDAPETLKISSEILFVIREWVSYICESWEDVIKNMPNFNNLVRNVEEHIKSDVQTDCLATSIFLAAIIRWIEMDATKDEKERFLFRSKIIKKKNFILPPLRRNYRKGVVKA